MEASLLRRMWRMPVTSVADQVVWRLAPEDAPAGEPAE